ncbi:hypothetical protein GPECTOR_10g1095 [Gonium pectorale]|uniref:Uncharacterized protein n=1 Tax=Gonium pectorale TaxID=33097 RepID=A0A150GQQ2_GONPE|nr:hypothetical protein GPECTOR_10g1095 [Gonium pectorale]|eukprot:KXZ52072.1 hypothetical protein GPECTOR_10g1095 [Gonium pectorale]
MPPQPNSHGTALRKHANGVYRPDLPRAYQAVDRDHPAGTKGLSIPTMTVLQQHCAFWDRQVDEGGARVSARAIGLLPPRDNDGRIYPLDTYRGCRELGMSFLLSLAFTWLLHFTLVVPYMTQDNWILHPYLCIHLKNIHRIKHASDTETFDEEGRMYPAKFEQIWETLGAEEVRSYADVRRLVWAKKVVADPIGWFASLTSWTLLWWVARDERGVLGRERVRRCYDGTLFYAIAQQRRAQALAPKLD